MPRKKDTGNSDAYQKRDSAWFSAGTQTQNNRRHPSIDHLETVVTVSQSYPVAPRLSVKILRGHAPTQGSQADKNDTEERLSYIHFLITSLATERRRTRKDTLSKRARTLVFSGLPVGQWF